MLKIGGLTVVDHDGEHAAAAKSGTVWAKAGVYPFEVGYFDAGGVEGPIPTEWLWH